MKRIADYLGRGAENARSLRELQEMTGLPSRTIRLRIAVERQNGIPICSDNRSGYWLAMCELEKRQFAISMRGRALEIMAAADGVESAVLDSGG